MSDVQPQLAAAPLVNDALQCPLCEYDMRGLTECRCPECGFTSTWEELTDPRRARHPYLFEHHPQHNVRSALKTFYGGLRPRRFWAAIYPTQPLRPGRLVLYGLICSTAVVVLFGLIEIALFAVQAGRASAQFSSAGLRPPVLTQSIWKAISRRDGRFVLITFVLVPALWNWLTFLSLSIYQISLRRSRLKTAHLLRVAMYSFDVVTWMGLFPVVFALASLPLLLIKPGLGASNPFLFNAMQMAVIGVPFGGLLVSVGSYRLWLACREYLHFNYALAVVIASQTIVFLAACCIVFTPDSYFHYIPGELRRMIGDLLLPF